MLRKCPEIGELIVNPLNPNNLQKYNERVYCQDQYVLNHSSTAVRKFFLNGAFSANFA
jgi:hypothetical protein